MEDTEDEEEARKIKLSRLGASSNFNTYFMPPQVSSLICEQMSHDMIRELEITGMFVTLGCDEALTLVNGQGTSWW